MINIDATYEKIAQLLGEDAQQTSEQLAKKLNISSATVRRRLKKLTSSGLLRFIGVIDPVKFGLLLAALIALDVSHDRLESTLDWLAEQPEVRWVSTSTGQFDIVAIAWFRSTDGLSEFMTKELSKLRGLNNSETFICLDVKKGRYVPYSHH